MDELEQRSQRADDPVTRSLWQILCWLVGWTSTAEVSRSTSDSVKWIREIARRYREDDAVGIGGSWDRRELAVPLASRQSG